MGEGKGFNISDLLIFLKREKLREEGRIEMPEIGLWFLFFSVISIFLLTTVPVIYTNIMTGDIGFLLRTIVVVLVILVYYTTVKTLDAFQSGYRMNKNRVKDKQDNLDDLKYWAVKYPYEDETYARIIAAVLIYYVYEYSVEYKSFGGALEIYTGTPIGYNYVQFIYVIVVFFMVFMVILYARKLAVLYTKVLEYSLKNVFTYRKTPEGKRLYNNGVDVDIMINGTRYDTLPRYRNLVTFSTENIDKQVEESVGTALYKNVELKSAKVVYKRPYGYSRYNIEIDVGYDGNTYRFYGNKLDKEETYVPDEDFEDCEIYCIGTGKGNEGIYKGREFKRNDIAVVVKGSKVEKLGVTTSIQNLQFGLRSLTEVEMVLLSALRNPESITILESAICEKEYKEHIEGKDSEYEDRLSKARV